MFGVDNNDNDHSDNKHIGKPWIGASYSCLVTIPKHMAEKYGLFKKNVYVLFEDTGEGVLIKKVKL